MSDCVTASPGAFTSAIEWFDANTTWLELALFFLVVILAIKLFEKGTKDDDET